MKLRPSAPAPLCAALEPAVELMPGDVVSGFAGDRFKTLLGSCISVILTDPRRTVAAMCHMVHAGAPNAANAGNTAYGEVALADMFARLNAAGAVPLCCEAYVFGGGNMFPGIYVRRNVGQSNCRWVLDYLDRLDIAVVGHCLGGNCYRKVAWTVGYASPTVETVFAAQDDQHHGH